MTTRDKETNQNTPAAVNGLVLAGGHSKRMNQDKSMMVYHGKSQISYCYDLLSSVCAKVYISNRQDQAILAGHREFPQIHDSFHDIGPLGGILSAMTAHPNTAWLVLACDLPFMDVQGLRHLLNHRNPSKMATAYASVTNPSLPEPLCAVYEPKILNRLLMSLDNGIRCPRKILLANDTALVNPPDQRITVNVNDLEDYHKALKEQ